MQAFQILQKTPLIPLFKLADEIMQEKMKVNNTLEKYGGMVIGNNDEQSCFFS